MSRDVIRITDAPGFGPGRFIRPPGGDYPWYANPVVVRKVDENSTAITVSNTMTETTIHSLTLPALTLASTGAARLSATGTIDKNTAGTATFRLKIADDSSTATVLATSGVSPATSTNPHAWSLEALLVGKQPGINRAWGVLDVAQAGAGATLKPSTYSSVGFSTMGLDETNQWTVEITVQLSAASTALSVTGQVAILEGVN